MLALTFVGRDDQRYLPFLIKRVMRIWPPFAVAIIASALLQRFAPSGSSGPYSQWFYESWVVPPNIEVVARHLDLTQLFVRPISELDSPMWSLVQEFRISLIFPTIVFFTLRRPFPSLISAVCLVFVAFLLIAGRHRELVSTVASTIGYVWLFVAGTVIAAKLDRVRALMRDLAPAWSAILWFVGIGFLAFSESGVFASIQQTVFILATGFGAMIVTSLCTVENRVTSVLETAVPRWLGKVSYSLYLIHLPVLLAVFRLFATNSFVQNAILSVALALVAAEIMHLTVEVPSMAAGRKMARWVGRTTDLRNQKATSTGRPSD